MKNNMITLSSPPPHHSPWKYFIFSSLDGVPTHSPNRGNNKIDGWFLYTLVRLMLVAGYLIKFFWTSLSGFNEGKNGSSARIYKQIIIRN